MPVIVECPQCQKIRKLKPSVIKRRKSLLCHSCSSAQNVKRMNKIRKVVYGKAHPLWKGGTTNKDGYIIQKIYSDNPFYQMTDKYGRIRQHRLIMAQHLKRCLWPWEIVHHRNGVRNDNRIENLELLPKANTHNVITRMQIYIEELKRENEILKRRKDASRK